MLKRVSRHAKCEVLSEVWNTFSGCLTRRSGERPGMRLVCDLIQPDAA